MQKIENVYKLKTGQKVVKIAKNGLYPNRDAWVVEDIKTGERFTAFILFATNETAVIKNDSPVGKIVPGYFFGQ